MLLALANHCHSKTMRMQIREGRCSSLFSRHFDCKARQEDPVLHNLSKRANSSVE